MQLCARRHHLVRAILVSIAQELCIQKNGIKVISTNVRAKNPEGKGASLLYHSFLFSSNIIRKSGQSNITEVIHELKEKGLI